MAKKTTAFQTRSATDFDKTLGLRIRTARNQKGMSQMQLAEALGCTFQQVQKYEKGKNRVSCAALPHIAQALGKPLDYFFDEVPYRMDSKAEELAQFVGSHTGNALAEAAMVLPPEQQAAVLQLARTLARAAA
jgi:transcriptional regulator with XRE-family HTH domain